MDFDVELMRELLFDLETRQTSPLSTISISIDEAAINMGRRRGEVERGLAGLFDLDYIDGPGVETPGFFSFRGLTQKGAQFVRVSRSPQDWLRLKRHFAQQRLEGTGEF